MHFAFRPRGSDAPWRYYRAPRWWDARAAATTCFPATDELDWETVSAEQFEAMLVGVLKRWIYDVTWTGHDAGNRPTRKMNVTELRRGSR